MNHGPFRPRSAFQPAGPAGGGEAAADDRATSRSAGANVALRGLKPDLGLPVAPGPL